MIKFNIGDVVITKRDPNNKSTIIDAAIEETGRIIYKVEKKGYFYTEDLQLVPVRSNDVESTDERMNSVIVTGGGGYVGSVLVRALLQEGYKVICIDSLKFGGRALDSIWGNPSFLFKKADIIDYSHVDSIIDTSKCFAMVHLAAIVGDPACKLEPELARRTNLDASAHLLDRAIESGIARFIFASTCSNYGKMKESGDYVDENSPLAPVSLYAKLKVEFEDILVNRMEKRESFSPTALRFATVFGISPRMRFDLTVNEFTKELALGRELVVFGEQFWRPYCHVSDFSKAIILVLRAPKHKVAYNVFNVGDYSQNYTKKMIVDELLQQIPEGHVKFVHKDEDPRDYRVRFDKIKNELGFRISKTVPEGINEVLTALRFGVIENPDDQRYYNIPVGQ
jgi:nucleoside-diphosphate-sugar epimerase